MDRHNSSSPSGSNTSGPTPGTSSSSCSGLSSRPYQCFHPCQTSTPNQLFSGRGRPGYRRGFRRGGYHNAPGGQNPNHNQHNPHHGSSGQNSLSNQQAIQRQVNLCAKNPPGQLIHKGFQRPPPKVQKRASKDGIEKYVSAFLKTCTTALSVPTEPLDDCGALGTYVAQKLRKMDENQQALAEQLITKIVTKGLRKRLTENTDVVESTSYPYQGYPASLHNTTTSTTTQHLPPEAASPGHTSDSAGSSLADYYCSFGTGSLREPH